MLNVFKAVRSPARAQHSDLIYQQHKYSAVTILMQVVVFIFQDQKCLQHAITVTAPSFLACNLVDPGDPGGLAVRHPALSCLAFWAN